MNQNWFCKHTFKIRLKHFLKHTLFSISAFHLNHACLNCMKNCMSYSKKGFKGISILICDSDLFLYTRIFKTNILNRVLSTKSPFTFVFELWIHKGYFVVKKLAGNVRIKAFWYKKFIVKPELFLKSSYIFVCFRCTNWLLVNFRAFPSPSLLNRVGQVSPLSPPWGYTTPRNHIYLTTPL